MFYGFILSDVLFLEYDLSTCKCQQKSDTSIFSVKTKPESSIFNNLLDVRMKVCLHQNPNYYYYKNYTPPSSAKFRHTLVFSHPLWILLN